MQREGDLAVATRPSAWNPQMPSSVDLGHFMGLTDDLLTGNKLGGQVYNSFNTRGGREGGRKRKKSFAIISLSAKERFLSVIARGLLHCY